MATEALVDRSMGLFGAISVGVGAIVGGGILALAGVAFATTGPAAILAFGLNGVIAILTALSFAELSASFPQSGGTYTFAKKVLSVRVAFIVGWVVWFASIVAAVLYALGFGSFAVTIIQTLWQADQGVAPPWLNSPATVTVLAIVATLLYTYSLTQQSGGGGPWANVGKVFVFGVLIAGGLWAFTDYEPQQIMRNLTPFLPAGFLGLVQAMGYTFIALQGFDLIAAVAGEVKDPGRTIPKAMLASLGIALGIYLPLLFIIMTVGMAPGQDIQTLSAAQPETVIALAAETYLGQFGYWLVLVAAILSMLSALQANLFAASRVALSMARDRTLSPRLASIDPKRNTPIPATLATTTIIIALLIILPDVASAGAASSLIFLITFALAHGISILARRRGDAESSNFKTPFFPLIPVVGSLTCLGLAVFQGAVVPAAGLIAAIWLGAGAGLYAWLFARRAQVVDASAEAMDPQLLRLRGRSPLVLVPIANPNNAEAMVFVANALTPPKIGRVLLLSVVRPPSPDWHPIENPETLIDTQAVLRQSLTASFEAGLTPEALTTIAADPWQEIARVAQVHRCESLLLGLTDLTQGDTAAHLEELMFAVDGDIVILRAPYSGWRPEQVKRVLVPVGGLGHHAPLRARLLGSLWRTGQREITFLQILPGGTSDQRIARAEQTLQQFAQDEVPGDVHVKVICSDDVAAEVSRQAQECDLIVLGLQAGQRGRSIVGNIPRQVARDTNAAILLLNDQ